ncbi:MAG: nuclear transport factor 2 family protein [Planctomycetes bacterium]|nr:nuclear transport factor 2 family protein [Planctomycetota bacterium]
MRNLVLVLSLLTLAACKSNGADPDVVTPMNASARVSPEERATGEILAVLRSASAAWNRGDLDGYMDSSYWHSPELTFFSGGSISKGYDATLEHYRLRYKSAGAEMGHLEFFGIESQPLAADAQLVRGHWKLTYSEKPADAGLFSLVMKRLPQGWRVVHDHSSIDSK